MSCVHCQKAAAAARTALYQATRQATSNADKLLTTNALRNSRHRASVVAKDQFVPLNIHFPWAPAYRTQLSTKSWRRLSDSRRLRCLALTDLYGLCDNGGGRRDGGDMR